MLPRNLQQIGQELAIVWDDGSESYLPLERLRRECPCATCKGEPDVLGRLTSENQGHRVLTPASFELVSWEFIGGYGFQPKWGDGHSSGIFTWDYLKNHVERPKS